MREDHRRKNQKRPFRIIWHLLSKVSRSFDLAIRALPEPLNEQVCVAYLVCRMVDTIEDAILPRNREALFDSFLEVLDRKDDSIIDGLAPETDGEIELLENFQMVMRVFDSFDDTTQKSIRKCAIKMTEGMRKFAALKDQKKELIQSEADLEEYCYYVAGTVGLMLSELFAKHAELGQKWVSDNRSTALAFAEGLQLVNILRDLKTDSVRYWHEPINEKTVRKLIAKALGRLKEAEEFIFAIPPREEGIRLFCAWPYFLALMSLSEISRGGQKVEKREMFSMMAEVEKAVADDERLKDLLGRYQATASKCP